MLDLHIARTESYYWILVISVRFGNKLANWLKYGSFFLSAGTIDYYVVNTTTFQMCQPFWTNKKTDEVFYTVHIYNTQKTLQYIQGEGHKCKQSLM